MKKYGFWCIIIVCTNVHAELTWQARNNLSNRLIDLVAQSNDIAQVERLLKLGANLVDNHPMTGLTPLTSALSNPRTSPEMIRYLLRRGAMLNSLDHLENNAFILAARNNVSPEIMHMLFNPWLNNPSGSRVSPVQINKMNQTGLNFLFQHAVRLQRQPEDRQRYLATLDCIKMTLRAMAAIKDTNAGAIKLSLNALGSYGVPGERLPQSTFSWAAYLGNMEILDLLLRLFPPADYAHLHASGYININLKDKYGRTALDWVRILPASSVGYDLRRRLMGMGVKPGVYV